MRKREQAARILPGLESIEYVFNFHHDFDGKKKILTSSSDDVGSGHNAGPFTSWLAMTNDLTSNMHAICVDFMDTRHAEILFLARDGRADMCIPASATRPLRLRRALVNATKYRDAWTALFHNPRYSVVGHAASGSPAHEQPFDSVPTNKQSHTHRATVAV